MLTKKASSIVSEADNIKSSSQVWSQARQANRVNMYSEFAGVASLIEAG